VIVPLGALLLSGSPVFAQYAAGKNYSPNVHLVSHVPLGPAGTVMDIEMEQELSRPFVFVSRSNYGRPASGPVMGFDALSIKDPSKAEGLYRWRMPEPELHQGLGGMAGKYFKLKGRYYYVQSFQYRGGGPDLDLGGIVFDMTSLPDTSGIKEVGRISAADTPG